MIIRMQATTETYQFIGTEERALYVRTDEHYWSNGVGDLCLCCNRELWSTTSCDP